MKKLWMVMVLSFSLLGNSIAFAGTSERLQYMRDNAVRETINRFTTSEINVPTKDNSNTTNGNDVDGLVTSSGINNNTINGKGTVSISQEEEQLTENSLEGLASVAFLYDNLGSTLGSVRELSLTSLIALQLDLDYGDTSSASNEEIQGYQEALKDAKEVVAALRKRAQEFRLNPQISDSIKADIDFFIDLTNQVEQEINSFETFYGDYYKYVRDSKSQAVFIKYSAESLRYSNIFGEYGVCCNRYTGSALRAMVDFYSEEN